MKLNCKAGDLAVIVCRNEVQHLGKIVQCISLWDEDSWICEPDLKGFDGAPLAWVDASLRPIRDNDGEDETLQWAQVPTKETTWTT